jgi:protein SCO1
MFGASNIGRTGRASCELIALAALGLSAVTTVASAATYGPLGRVAPIDPAVVRIDEPKYLGSPVNGNYLMRDSTGKTFRLADMMGKPLILLFSYYGCDGSCPTVNANLAAVLRKMSRFKLGRDYHVLTVSFDQHDTVASARAFVKKINGGKPLPTGWRHAVLAQPKSDIGALTSSLGYRYFWSREDQVFLHPNVMMFLTPQGRVARYLYGTAMSAKEVELALIDADWGRISNAGQIGDLLTGACYSYNFATGKYTINTSLLVGVAALGGGIALVLFSLSAFRTKQFFRTRKSRRLNYVQ